ncbi:MAG TPA: hypothetical protein EYN06_08950, partial [Myxococcales bacterium]|nr:hypothetical protein [Myxococcales bacterium]
MNEFLDSLARLFLGPQAQDDPNISAHWVGMSDWSHWQEWLIIALVVLILAITIWNLRRAPTVLSKIVLFLLRTGALAVLLFVFYQPAIVEETRARSTNTIVLLADDSSSMAQLSNLELGPFADCQ